MNSSPAAASAQLVSVPSLRASLVLTRLSSVDAGRGGHWCPGPEGEDWKLGPGLMIMPVRSCQTGEPEQKHAVTVPKVIRD